MSTVKAFFGWPTGGIWSNLLASLLWAIPAWVWARHHVHRIHRRLDEHADRHDEHAGKLDELARSVALLHDHAAGGKPVRRIEAVDRDWWRRVPGMVDSTEGE